VEADAYDKQSKQSKKSSDHLLDQRHYSSKVEQYLRHLPLPLQYYPYRLLLTK
jgi:hypothetical protein